MITIDWHPEPAGLKRFGLWMIILCAAAAGVLYLKGGGEVAVYVLAFGIVAGGLGLTGTAAALPFYWLWMSISMVMGAIIAPIVFAILYYLFITPYGFVLRSCGRDPLLLKRRETDTYWQDAKPVTDKKRYRRQF